MRGFIVKFRDKSIKMSSVAVPEPSQIFVGKFTVLFRLYITNRVNHCLQL